MCYLYYFISFLDFSLCLLGMGLEERVAESCINGHKADCTWTVSVHTFSDITNISPVVFLYLLKECYIHGKLFLPSLTNFILCKFYNFPFMFLSPFRSENKKTITI